MTGFARMLIFLLFIVPLAFFGASYINGEDPVQKIKNFTGMGEGGTSKVAVPTDNQSEMSTATMEKRILQLERDLAIANEKLARCQTAGVE